MLLDSNPEEGEDLAPHASSLPATSLAWAMAALDPERARRWMLLAPGDRSLPRIFRFSISNAKLRLTPFTKISKGGNLSGIPGVYQ